MKKLFTILLSCTFLYGSSSSLEEFKEATPGYYENKYLKSIYEVDVQKTDESINVLIKNGTNRKLKFLEFTSYYLDNKNEPITEKKRYLKDLKPNNEYNLSYELISNASWSGKMAFKATNILIDGNPAMKEVFREVHSLDKLDAIEYKELYIKSNKTRIEKLINNHLISSSDKSLHRKLGLFGTANVSFDILSNSNVENIKITKSSGYALIDDKILEAIKDTSNDFPSTEHKINIDLNISL